MYRLFHIIVDTDRTASQILSVMNKQKMAGEVTFLPLNKLQPPNPTYPQAKVVTTCQYTVLNVRYVFVDRKLNRWSVFSSITPYFTRLSCKCLERLLYAGVLTFALTLQGLPILTVSHLKVSIPTYTVKAWHIDYDST